MYILRIFRAFHYPTSFVAKILGTSEMTDLSYSKYCVCKDNLQEVPQVTE